MKLALPETIDGKKIQRVHLPIAGIFFLFMYSVILTLSPSVRLRTWDVNYLWSHWIGFILWMAGFLWFSQIAIPKAGFRESLLVPIICVLCGWGILTIWRISIIFGLRQSIWFLVSIFTAGLFIRHPLWLQTARKYKYGLLLIGLILAALTFIFGTYPGGNGPRLWLGARGIYFQPTELLKLMLILYLSAYFSESRYVRMGSLNSILPALLLFLSSLFLLLAQRDMGTSLIFITIFIFMLFVRYGKRRVLLFGALIFLITAGIGFATIDLVRIRILSWILPWMDPQTGSYQIIQSIIGIAAGGITGSGIGLGSPGLVPIAHSDFIYASVVEETGLFGAIALLILYALIFTRGIKIAIQSKDSFHQHLAAGIVIYLTAQTILIIGGNIRLLPITGVTLPFMSYGGSSLLVSFLAFCFLILIENEDAPQIKREMIAFKTSGILTAFFLTGLVLLAVVTGWWSFVRSRDLQLRSDNPRHFIAARYVKRGTILDRNNRIIAETVGEIGGYQRFVTHPPMSNTVGFSNLNYGKAGLEAQWDDYLSGERGYPASEIWFNYLLYDQPLPGRDIRLTIDLDLQEQVDQLMGEHQGGAVVMNAETGEILALATHPFYNANNLAENWETWRIDDSSPLLNRAVQGAYPIGNLLSPFLLSRTRLLFAAPDDTYFEYRSRFGLDQCAQDSNSGVGLRSAITNGCDSAIFYAMNQLDQEEFSAAIQQYGITASQDIGLPKNETAQLSLMENWYASIFGDEPLRVNPLQVAVSASSFSAAGRAPEARIASSVHTANEGWVVLRQSQSRQIEQTEIANQINALLNSEEISGWEMTAVSRDSNGAYTWYMAGTPNSWPGTPLVVVLLIEEDAPEFTRSIGREIYLLATE